MPMQDPPGLIESEYFLGTHAHEFPLIRGRWMHAGIGNAVQSMGYDLRRGACEFHTFSDQVSGSASATS
jgi:hypothetical protein